MSSRIFWQRLRESVFWHRAREVLQMWGWSIRVRLLVTAGQGRNQLSFSCQGGSGRGGGRQECEWRGVSLPAGALTIGVTLELAVYDINVKISSEQPGVAISPAGALGVFLPHGLKFEVPVTIILKYDPSKVPAGDEVFIYYFDEDLSPPIWTQMSGKV